MADLHFSNHIIELKIYFIALYILRKSVFRLHYIFNYVLFTESSTTPSHNLTLGGM